MTTSLLNLVRCLDSGVETFSDGGKDYTRKEAEEVLRQALIEANGGAVFSYKNYRHNKIEIYEILEALTEVAYDDFKAQDMFWNRFVERRNGNYGDRFDFRIPNNSLYIVSVTANGVFTPEKQAIGSTKKVSLTPEPHVVRAYADWEQFMAGRIDWAKVAADIGRSFSLAEWVDIAAAITAVSTSTSTIDGTTLKTGSWDEDLAVTTLSTMEAQTGTKPIIAGTAAALRKVTSSVVSDKARDNMINTGYYGKFFGYDEILIPQAINPKTGSAIYADTTVHFLPAGEQFVKYAESGSVFIDDKDIDRTADGTKELVYRKDFAVGILVSKNAYGRYVIS